MRWHLSLLLRADRFAMALVVGLSLSAPMGAYAAGQLDKAVEVQQYDIPSQPLADAVQAFARISGQMVTFSSASLAGRRSKAVRGPHSAEAALRLLLDGSNVEVTRGMHGVWMLKVRPVVPRAPAEVPPASHDKVTPIPNDAPSELEAIVVTGTHIEKSGPIGSRVFVIDAEDIRRSGFSGTEQVIQALPQNFRGGEAGASADVNMSLGAQRGYNMAAGSGPNLRGLGSNATLVLINGRRISASSAGTFTDISMIPVDAIERIEVLSDGASAVYGADAVGGVVNVILKSGVDHSESRASYGSTTEDGRDEARISHTFGRQWNRGDVVVTLDYLDQSALTSNERDFTSSVPAPTSVLPSNRMESLLINGSFAATDSLTLKGDVQYSKATRELITVDGWGREENVATPVRRNLAGTADYLFPNEWAITADVFASSEDTTGHVDGYLPDGSFDYSYVVAREQVQRGAEVRGSGPVLETAAGVVRLAMGVGYKEERYERTLNLYGIRQNAERNNNSAFAELYVPLVGDRNSRIGLRGLALSLAARYDNYSDFGSTTNPRIGLDWSPTDRITVRSSFSTSFRAPSIGEEARASEDGLSSMELGSAPLDNTGDTWVPVLTLLGSERLKPEISRNRSFGVEWRPAFAEGLSMELTYWNVQYTDRIVLPPYDVGILYEPEFQPFVQRYNDPAEVRALVDAATARGVRYYDFTFGEFGDDPLAQTVFAYSYLWTNAQRVDMSGVDVSVKYPFRLADHRFDIGVEASYIGKMKNRLTEESTPYDLVGTYGNPPRLKARGTVSWAFAGFDAAINVNYSSSYTDTTGLIDRDVRPYTTVDLATRYAFMNGVSISLNVLNAFDEQPPYIHASGRGSHYDPGNASPLGRMVTMQIAKRW